ncbi:MmcQ/YjbR family DNA-binding protein [Streptococcus ferus]|uniref:MmcQ/YjbR family DNA-binding protein n=1 Tax=Streptococcus ferus TaxID=1345 RepID=UPI0035A0C6BE
MTFTKRQLLDWLLGVTGAEEAYPFTREKSRYTPVIRHKHNQKMLALVTEKDGKRLLNLKLKPEQVAIMLDTKGVIPAYHMNKKHWLTVLVNETELTENELKSMVLESSRLTQDH